MTILQRLLLVLAVSTVLSTSIAGLAASSTVYAASPASQQDCDKAKEETFFGMPVWYKYLPYTYNDKVKACVVGKAPDYRLETSDYTLIGFGVIDILLRLGGLVAVLFVIYGGFQYVISQGEPDNLKKARETVINALIGLAVVLIAAPLVSFIATRLTS